MQPLEPAARVLAATSVSQSLSFCLERKYLQDITEKPMFELDTVYSVVENEVSWISIDQIGKPIEKSAESCFTAIQKILYSCFLPKDIQLLFLLIGDGKECHMYLGLRSPGKALPPKNLLKNLNEFMKGVWPGLHTTIIHGEDKYLSKYKSSIEDDTFENIFAFTGIPSMESQYKTLYPATLDKLIAGMSKCKNYAYLIVADPVDPSETEFMLYQCREMNGQAESLKTMTVTDGLSFGKNTSYSSSSSSSHTDSTSESLSKKDFTKLGKLAMTATGLSMAATVFPAAGAVLNGCMDTAGAITTAAASMLGCSMIGNFVSGMMPQKTNTVSSSDTLSETATITNGTSESKSNSISRNLVNKHIESVSEHLFYHSKRLETGKATGLWKVGVYLMADRKSDIQGGALQLRSILSGQESIFEPIRIHDISAILDEDYKNNKTLKELTLGNFSSPIIAINDNRGRRFDHPFGDQYKELKTVLSTKELSYLVNFPLRSVPGISVVDSSPEFSYSTPKIESNQLNVSFGKLLYGGTITDTDYSLGLDSLTKHTLLCGIYGSGKTHTCQSILSAINAKIPFLVIESNKTEYIDWAISYNQNHPDNRISIFMPGQQVYRSKQTREEVNVERLKLNPFDIICFEKGQDAHILCHIDRLKSILASAFPTYDILPIIIEDLIYTLYSESNLLHEFSSDNKFTLKDMKSAIDSIINGRGYEERVERNLKACLNTRFDSLLRGWKGELLNSLETTGYDKLFDKPCIVNLSCLVDDSEKNFVMSLLLLFLYEYRIACAESGKAEYNICDCEHLTVVEDAHRVVGNFSNQESPQYKSAMIISNMLTEFSSLGEGIFFIDREPSRIISETTKNTNTKIVHRLLSEVDCKLIGETLGISKEQLPIIPKLKIGQCIVSTSLSTDKYWVKVNGEK